MTNAYIPQSNMCRALTHVMIFGLAASAQMASAAPDIHAPYVGVQGGGSIVAGQAVTFTGDVRNSGDGMDFSNSYRAVSIWSFPQSAWPQYDIAVAGNRFYVTGGWPPDNGSDTFSQFDNSTMPNPAKMYSVKDIQYAPGGIVTSGNYAYVSGDYLSGSDWIPRLLVYDISTQPPTLVRSLTTLPPGQTTGVPEEIGIYGDYLYIYIGHKLLVYSILTRTNPQFVRQVVLGSSGYSSVHRQMAIDSGYLYVTAFNRGSAPSDQEFQIYNLFDPSNPQKEGGLDLPFDAHGVAVSGNYAYVTSRDVFGSSGSFYIISTAPKNSPSIVAEIVNKPSREVIIIGNYAYVESGFISVYDISNPASPVEKQRYFSNTSSELLPLSSNRYMYSVGSGVGIHEPRTLARFCVTNSSSYDATEATNCLTNATGRIGSDIDVGNLGSGAVSSPTVTWPSATVGSHMLYFCTDVLVGGFDGVGEGSEGAASNCSSLSISVASPPAVTTNAATDVGPRSAMLNGSVNPNNANAAAWFRYSTVNPGSCNDSFGTRFPASGSVGVGNGGVAVPYQLFLTGLTSGTTYYYCAIGQNSAGVRFGNPVAFTTAQLPNIVSSGQPTYTGTLTTGSQITFTGITRNSGSVGMTTQNSFDHVLLGYNQYESGVNVNSNNKPIAVNGNYVYVLEDYYEGNVSNSVTYLRTFNVADPRNITEVTTSRLTFPASTYLYGDETVLIVSGNRLYAGVYHTSGPSNPPNDLMVFDITNPAAPVFLGGIEIVALSNGARTLALYQNRYLFALGVRLGSNHPVVDFGNPASPQTLVSNFIATDYTSIADGLAIQGDYAYVVRNPNTGSPLTPEFEVYYIGNPASPVRRSHINLPQIAFGRAGGVFVYGNTAYVGYPGGTYAVNIIDPYNPFFVQSINGLYSPFAVSGNYLYDRDLSAYDLTTPTNPVSVGGGYGNLIGDIAMRSDFTFDIDTDSGAYERVDGNEPHTFSRFCVDGVDANACLTSTATRIGGTDHDAGRLASGATHTANTTWTATLGTHTIYFCTDALSSSGFDGVAESAEGAASNCTSRIFTVIDPFNFSLANGGNRSVGQGNAVTNTVTANLTAGATQAVTFSASGLPAGASASFSAPSCNPTCTTTMTISTTGSTPIGNSTITVTGTSGSLTRTTSFTLTVSPVIIASVSGGNGSITPNGSVAVPYNGSQSFTVTPNSGYSVTSLVVDGTSQGPITSYNFTGVTSNHTITATFDTICRNGYDSLGNIPITSADRTPIASGQRYRVTKFGGNYCFGNNGGPTYLVPLNTWTEFQSFWNAITRTSPPPLPGMYTIP